MRACAQSEIYRDARLRALVEPAADACHPVQADGADQRDAFAAGHRRGGAAARRPPRRAPGERAVYLHEIQDPGNLGTILRTLAWFGNFRCLLSPDSVDVHNGKVVRASMGAIFHVPVEIDVPMDVAAANDFARIACLDLDGEPVASPAFREFDCYVFGNEARGLPREQMSDARRTAVHDSRNRRDRVAERGGDGEHLPVRAQPRELTTIYGKLMFSSGMGTPFQAVSQRLVSYWKSKTTSCWLFSPTSLACVTLSARAYVISSE